jgi:hypothetical protein
MQDTTVQIKIEAMNTYTPRHLGAIYITHGLFGEMDALLDINSTDVQSKLRDDGMFDRMHQLLLLPESYTIVAIFCDVLYGQWRIIVESDSIPLVKPGDSYPEVKPLYTRNEDGSAHLTEITAVTIQHALSLEEMVKGFNKRLSGE